MPISLGNLGMLQAILVRQKVHILPKARAFDTADLWALAIEIKE
jgi:hypothetical protein